MSSEIFILDCMSKVIRLIDKLRLVNPKNIAQPIYKVTIEPYKAKRSVSQNRLLWLWMNEISNKYYETRGKLYSPDMWAEYFKQNFIESAITEIRGEAIKMAKTTTQMTTKEFTDYLEKIDIYVVSELDIILPHPDDLYYSAMGINVEVKE